MLCACPGHHCSAERGCMRRARWFGRCSYVSSSQAPSFRENGRPAAVGKCPPSEGAKRRQALVRNAAPGGSPYGKARPFSGREQPAHNADRRAYRRFAAAFSLDLGTAFWKRTGAADRRNALDSAGFPPRSSAPPARCRTDPCSWAGRCLPRPPEARLARPNPQAPHPPRSHASHENALGRVDRMSEHQAIEQIKNKPNRCELFWAMRPK